MATDWKDRRNEPGEEHLANIYYWSVKQVAYASVPKVASTALSRALTSALGPPDVISKHHLHHLQQENPKLFTFSFVRDPYDRLVSAWADKIVNYQKSTDRVLQQHPNMEIGMGFKQFVRALAAHKKKYRNQHFEKQDQILSGFKLQFVGKFENLTSDWIKVQEAIWGIDTHMPLSKERPSIKGDWRVYYDGPTATLAAHLFKEDFKRFKYDTTYDR